MKKLVVMILVALLGGCASVPESWKQPIAPKVSASHEVEYPWEALAVRNVDGKLIRVQIPEGWYRWQFPYVPVREPESKEVIPLQRMTSRVALFCVGRWFRSSAVATGDRYDVLIPDPCRDSDRGVILSGSGKHILTFEGKMVLDVDIGRLMNDTKYRKEFFVSHPSVVHRPQNERLPVEVTRLFNQIAIVDGVRYRTGYESLRRAVSRVRRGRCEYRRNSDESSVRGGEAADRKHVCGSGGADGTFYSRRRIFQPAVKR